MVERLDRLANRLLELLDVADAAREMRLVEPEQRLEDVDPAIRAMPAGTRRVRMRASPQPRAQPATASSDARTPPVRWLPWRSCHRSCGTAASRRQFRRPLDFGVITQPHSHSRGALWQPCEARRGGSRVGGDGGREKRGIFHDGTTTRRSHPYHCCGRGIAAGDPACGRENPNSDQRAPAVHPAVHGDRLQTDGDRSRGHGQGVRPDRGARRSPHAVSGGDEGREPVAEGHRVHQRRIRSVEVGRSVPDVLVCGRCERQAHPVQVLRQLADAADAAVGVHRRKPLQQDHRIVEVRRLLPRHARHCPAVPGLRHRTADQPGDTQGVHAAGVDRGSGEHHHGDQERQRGQADHGQRSPRRLEVLDHPATAHGRRHGDGRGLVARVHQQGGLRGRR